MASEIINPAPGGNELIDDDSMATATSSNVPSAESVKAYVDASGGGGSVLYTASGITSSKVISQVWSNVAGGSLAPIPTEPVIASSVVIASTADVITINFRSTNNSHAGGRIMGYRIDTGTPVPCLYDYGSNDYTVQFTQTITGLAAGTYDFELVAARESSNFTIYPDRNYAVNTFTVKVN